MALPQGLFNAYTQMPERIAPRAWTVLRWCGVACGLGIAISGIVDPSVGLKAFWGVFVPLAPLMFLVAPGLWRNVCPMASLNQIPRTLGFTRGRTLPLRVQQFAPLISAALFLLVVPLRKALLDHNGVAFAAFLFTVLALAFIGGVVFKGKSGWCTQFCPMLQVERFYGQSPLLVVRNSHCRPCVGCTKNCHDFNPTAAYLADLHDENPRLATNRKLFAGAMPWLIAAFFTQPYLTAITPPTIAALYASLLLFVAAGIGVFMVVEAVTPFTAQQIILGHVVAAITIFYWFVTPLALGQFGVNSALLSHAIQAGVVVLALVWLWRAWPRERAFLSSAHASAPARVADNVLRVHNALRSEQAQVVFTPGPTVLVKAGASLLDVAEANGVAMESGCRMGMCGADPVRIVAGAENLSPVVPAERATLERLGLPSDCRMACCARVHGPLTVTPSVDTAAAPQPTGAPAAPVAPAFTIDSGVRRVVVIGNGAAGATAAVELRAAHPDAEITIIGSEPYDFYNRMSIDRLVAEATAIDKLYLMPRDWTETRRIRYLRGVSAQRIDPDERRVITDEDESLPYDRLILATGARGDVPRIEGYGMRGCFSLRTINDAVEIQQYIRRNRCRTALVVGGGPLGLEAAHSMSQMGMRVYVADRGPWPLSRHLDGQAGALLRQMMDDLGVVILPQTEARRLLGADAVRGAELSDGRTRAIDLCLVAAGIQPNVELARAAGLSVNRGVVVDDRLTTSDPAIFAIGDVAEHRGRIYGLWPACVDQAHVAALNLLGGDLRYEAVRPPVKLKVPGMALLSVGDVEARGADGRALRFDDPNARRYRKLVLCSGKVCGAILIGHAEIADAVTRAVEAHQDVSADLAALERGDWSALTVERGRGSYDATPHHLAAAPA